MIRCVAFHLLLWQLLLQQQQHRISCTLVHEEVDESPLDERTTISDDLTRDVQQTTQASEDEYDVLSDVAVAITEHSTTEVGNTTKEFRPSVLLGEIHEEPVEFNNPPNNQHLKFPTSPGVPNINEQQALHPVRQSQQIVFKDNDQKYHDYEKQKGQQVSGPDHSKMPFESLNSFFGRHKPIIAEKPKTAGHQQNALTGYDQGYAANPTGGSKPYYAIEPTGYPGPVKPTGPTAVVTGYAYPAPVTTYPKNNQFPYPFYPHHAYVGSELDGVGKGVVAPFLHETGVSPWKRILQLIGAFIPIGFLLATLTPSFLKIDTASNQTNQITSQKLTRLGDLPMEHKEARLIDQAVCEDKLMCEWILKGNQPGANLMQNILFNLAKGTTEEISKKSGLFELFEAVKKKDCSSVNCTSYNPNNNESSSKHHSS